jgi:hypothetical protein
MEKNSIEIFCFACRPFAKKRDMPEKLEARRIIALLLADF